MPKFVFAYHGGPHSMSPEEGRAHMESWMTWMAGLGSAMVDRGLAVGSSTAVRRDGVTVNCADPISGYSVIDAGDLAAAIAIAQRCPHLDIGGTIEIAPALDMAM